MPELLMKLKVFLFFFFIVKLSYSQSSYPQDYFINPLKIPLSLSGNFGELRNNHFHSGLDIRTQQRTGLDVVATADGYISRLKIGPWGYGNVLYIQHPNGFTTVYGHLDEFAPKIRAYVRQRQYSLKKSNIELYPEQGELPVTQGEVIAKSGNTGGSGGPHLHYEFRDGNQNPLNPLLFGIKIKDTRPPKINDLYVYPQGGGAYANTSEKEQKIQLISRNNGTYTTDPVEALGEIGFGISAQDYTDGAPYTTGIYDIQTCVDDEPNLDITFSKFSFSNTRYINDYIDYAYYIQHNKKIQKLFLEESNKMDMPIDQINNGLIHVEDGKSYTYEIVLTDYSGNQTLITVPIRGKTTAREEIQIKKVKETPFLALANQSNSFQLEHHSIHIPKGALYKDMYLDLDDSAEQVHVHNDETPLHKNISISFNADTYPSSDFEKLYVARINSKGRKIYSSTTKKKGKITTETNVLGTYTLVSDTTPPQITPVNFKNEEWISDRSFLKLRITDRDSGVSMYSGTLNGEFIVLEYDYKTGIIKYDFRDRISKPGKNEVNITVTDNVGNTATFHSTFYRKE